jgi:hypothetical protein
LCSCLAGVGIAQAAPDFETQVLPVLTRAGCNSGACHGAAIGRGGFRLSLLGYDPQADYDNLVLELKGRRVNLAQPEKSLVLRKPNGSLNHQGGLKLRPDGDGHALLLDWIRAGAPRGGGRSLTALEVSPATVTLPAIGRSFRIRVVARFSDGTQAEVTPWALLTPTDPAALECSADGEVTARRRGQSAVMVRFLGEVGGVRVTVPLTDEPLPSEARPRFNFIDDHVNRTLDQLRLPHSPRCDDTTFVRRAYLDLIGALPSPAEVDTFLRNDASDRRERLVSDLMTRPEFVNHWAYRFGDLFRIESRRLQPQGAKAFHDWVRDALARDLPLDRLARELLLARGDSYAIGPANFHRVAADPGSQAEYVSQVFLGVRLQCANCHNHPLDRWTQDDYHGLAAVFARLGRGRDVQPLPRGEVIHPKTGKAAVPRLPGEANLPDGTDPLPRFAEWLTAPANPFFARAAVNRVWRELMGRGLVEPVDDHRTTNPATHPELLDALAADFIKHGHSLRHVVRTIVTSEAYQRSSLSSGSNRSDDRFYSRALLRPLPPPVLVDAVARVTGVAEQLGDLPAGTAAVSLGDSRVPSVALDLLGRCARDAGCTPAPASGSLSLALHKINGAWLNRKISAADGRLHRLLREKDDDAAIVSELYQVALCRKPTARELSHWKEQLAASTPDERVRRFEDFLWALLNATEFGCNH